MQDKRRDLLKALTLGSGAVAATQLPSNWSKPVVESVVLPGHAQTTGPAQTTCLGMNPDIELTVSSDPSPAEVGEQVTLTSTFTNVGDVPVLVNLDGPFISPICGNFESLRNDFSDGPVTLNPGEVAILQDSGIMCPCPDGQRSSTQDVDYSSCAGNGSLMLEGFFPCIDA